MNDFLNRMKHWHKVAYFLVAYDFMTVLSSYFLALWVRFDCKFSTIEVKYIDRYFIIIIPYALCVVFVYWLFGLYRSIWRFASFYELKNLVFATIITIGTKALIVSLFLFRMPI